jgi:hypothetical protein
LLKALIKLAAAGLKVREGRAAGVRTHATRAGALFEALKASGGLRRLGLDLEFLIEQARKIAEQPPEDPAPRGAAVSRVYEFRLEPAQ